MNELSCGEKQRVDGMDLSGYAYRSGSNCTFLALTCMVTGLFHSTWTCFLLLENTARYVATCNVRKGPRDQAGSKKLQATREAVLKVQAWLQHGCLSGNQIGADRQVTQNGILF